MPEHGSHSTRDLPVRVGERLAGKYRVERVLGAGSMGVVVAAMHEQLEERVAIKLMLSAGAKKPEHVERFLREARAAVKIKNAHVARVIDVGALDDGRFYMVMEYLEGTDLSKLIVDRGPLPAEVAVDYVLQVCEVLVEAHALGIVHRDLKPSNLFLTETSSGAPLVKVLDFGISKFTRKGEQEDARLTASEAMIGSPLYMSPEQIRSARDVDERADIWALGVILHELITARVPFEGDTHMAILASISADLPTLLREHKPGSSPELEAIIARCLEKNASNRFQSVMELARALGPFGPEEAVPSIERVQRSATTGRTSGVGVAVRVAAPVDVMAETVTTIAESTPDKRRQRFVALATVLGGVSAVATATFLSLGPGARHDSIASANPSAAAASSVAALVSAAASSMASAAAIGSSSASAAVPVIGSSSAPAAATAPTTEVAPPVASLSASPGAPATTASAKPPWKAAGTAKPSLPAASSGIRLGKEIDTRR